MKQNPHGRGLTTVNGTLLRIEEGGGIVLGANTEIWLPTASILMIKSS